MKTIGYTHGRFQPFHKGHLAVLLYILNSYDELWIGISNPLRRLPHNIATYEESLKKSILEARAENKNIFTYFFYFAGNRQGSLIVKRKNWKTY